MRRFITRRFWLQTGWRVALPAVAAGIVIAVAVAVRGHNTAELDQRICAKVDQLVGVQLASLDRAEKTLPTLAYYREHPGELGPALGSIAYQREQLVGATC